MKAFSLWQPWAQFMALGWKLNETRSWATKYRGLLVIHAAKTRVAMGDVEDALAQQGFRVVRFDFGAFLCVVNLVDCVPVEKVRDTISARERALGDYSDGRFAWITRDCRPFEQPIPGRGAQGLFAPPLGVIGAYTRLINLPGAPPVPVAVPTGEGAPCRTKRHACA